MTNIFPFGTDPDGAPPALIAADARGDQKALLGGTDRMAFMSARNVDGARVVPADTLNVADMLAHKSLVLTVDAVRRIEALWGGERAAKRDRVEA